MIDLGLITVLAALSVGVFACVYIWLTRSSHNVLRQLLEQLSIRVLDRDKSQQELRQDLLSMVLEQREQLRKSHIESLNTLTDSVYKSMGDIRSQIACTLNSNAAGLNQKVELLTNSVDTKLQEVAIQVERRLTNGFEQTTAIFTDVVKRLTIIDEAQKRITELSSSVLNLQEILSDKRARGALGEVQLAALLGNLLPTENFSLQYTLSNGKRVDCLLHLPDPTGKLSIDAKFPLESYRRFADPDSPDGERRMARQQFHTDVRKHMQDIADKYIVPGETTNSAIMFIPAEAIFAEIHSHHPELIELSQKLKVWLVSPSTLMAVLTTARSVIKDAATKNQIHVIQQHLAMLHQDFSRFQVRMDALAKHIGQAHTDVNEVQVSAKKISTRFNHIEQARIEKVL